MSDRYTFDDLRSRYRFACGYCSVTESECGSLLERDHFRPKTAGGDDSLDNLVYCCSGCNRFKRDYWTSSENSDRRLIHPLLERIDDHLFTGSEGVLIATTARGQFHIDRLHLNRQPLIALRLSRITQVEGRRERERLDAQLKEIRSTLDRLERMITETSALIREPDRDP